MATRAVHRTEFLSNDLRGVSLRYGVWLFSSLPDTVFIVALI